jgi:hypothetical protein
MRDREPDRNAVDHLAVRKAVVGRAGTFRHPADGGLRCVRRRPEEDTVTPGSRDVNRAEMSAVSVGALAGARTVRLSSPSTARTTKLTIGTRRRRERTVTESLRRRLGSSPMEPR